jgi:hypothetical protein
MTVPARYVNGVFKPLKAVRIEEGTLVEVHLPPSLPEAGRRVSLTEVPFFGLWRDRDEMGDGTEYVDKLRDNPRG